MSAAEAHAEPRTTRRAALAAVPAPQRRGWPRGTLPLIILGLLAAGMVGHLALQTKIQEQGFELGALQAQVTQSAAQEAVLQAALDRASTPQQLAFAASHLGMVANPYSTFLVLPTGEVRGLDKPVRGSEVPIISAPPNLATGTALVDPLATGTQPAGTTAGLQP